MYDMITKPNNGSILSMFDSVFDTLSNRTFDNNNIPSRSTLYESYIENVSEDGLKFDLILKLPGVNPKDITVNLEQGGSQYYNYLIITWKYADNDTENKRYRVSSKISEKDIKVTYNYGELIIKCSSKELEKEKKTIPIKIDFKA